MKNKKTVSLVCNIVAVCVACFMLFPVAWIILNSFKADVEMFSRPISILPKNPSLNAYTKTLMENNLLRAFCNSAITALGALTLGLVLGVSSAYGLARYKMRSAKLVLFSFLITQMLPASLLLTPLYLTYNRLGFLNTYLAPVLSVATISIPFVVITTRPFFLSLPKGVDDAARIDGCNAFTAFIRIMLPIAKPGLLTAGALAFIFGWNDLIYSMTFSTKPDLKPMTSIFYNLMPMEGIQWSAVMALATVIITPILILFVTLQKYIVGGLAAGAVKE